MQYLAMQDSHPRLCGQRKVGWSSRPVIFHSGSAHSTTAEESALSSLIDIFVTYFWGSSLQSHYCLFNASGHVLHLVSGHSSLAAIYCRAPTSRSSRQSHMSAKSARVRRRWRQETKSSLRLQRRQESRRDSESPRESRRGGRLGRATRAHQKM